MKRQDRATYVLLKREFRNPTFRKKLIENLGSLCCNCGSDLDIEYHHIVPLSLGGSNRITNIAPLCYVCHQVAHGSRNIRRICKPQGTGRPRMNLTDDYKTVITEYLCGIIDRDTCNERLGIKGANKFTDKPFFKEYLAENKIVKYRNLLGRPKDDKGALASYILYEDGRIERHYRDGRVEMSYPQD